MNDLIHSVDDVLSKACAGDRVAREDLARHYMPLVRGIAANIGRRLPKFVLRDDLVAYGCDGLARAINLADPARADQFDAFVAVKVRGAMLDGVRVFNQLRRKRLAGASDVRVMSLSELVDQRSDEEGRHDCAITFAARPEAQTATQEADDWAELLGLINDDEQRRTASLYFRDDLTAREIATRSGITTSSVNWRLRQAAIILADELRRRRLVPQDTKRNKVLRKAAAPPRVGDRRVVHRRRAVRSDRPGEHWPSAAQAARELGKNEGAIRKAVVGNYRTAGRRFFWAEEVAA